MVFDTFVRVSFSCLPPADASGLYVSRAAYVDLNRSNLFEVVGLSEKPPLEPGARGPSTSSGRIPCR